MIAQSRMDSEMVFTEELFDRYPPPPEAHLTEKDIKDIKSSVLGRRILVPAPTPEQLITWRKDSHAHYAIWRLYHSY